MKNLFAKITLLIVFAIPVYAQQTQSQKDEEVVRVSTNLVQVDAVVTDKSNNQVTNLTTNDFEILQDGKLQTITNLLYVRRNLSAETNNQSQPNTISNPVKNAPVQSASLQTAELRRILTFVVDDGGCDSTFSGISAAQEGVEKFVNEQMLANDLVAIYRTRAGSSLLQQYTSDKSRLLTAVKKIRWYPPNGVCTNVTGDVEAARNDSKIQGGTFESDMDKATREGRENYNKDRQVNGVIGVLQYAINGLRNVGGRKILFLMSNSLPISNGKTTFPTAFDAIRDLTASANRASVVINTIDISGLSVPMANAADDIAVRENALGVDDVLKGRAADDNTRQSGLSYAANETGGKFYRNANNLDVPVQKALSLEKGYYLVSYQPEGDTFEGKKFHKIEIKVKRPDLNVSSRSGFFGVTDQALRPKARTGDSELYDALAAPLPNSDLNVQLSAYFANTSDKGNYIHALLYVDGKDITFADDTNGSKKAIFDVVAVTLDEKNKVIDDSNHTNTVHIPIDKIDEIKNNGLIYTVDVPVKKAGVYTFRTALREAAAKRLGSASQVIEVPDLKKDKLLVSGLILSGVDGNGKLLSTEAAKTDNEFSTVVSKAVPAIRQFRRNTIVGYAYTIYNAKLDAANKTNLSIQVNLYRDGKLFSEGKPGSAQIEPQTDMTRIRDYGYLRLNPNVLPGDYTLQIIIKDSATNQTTNQSIDFEIVE